MLMSNKCDMTPVFEAMSAMQKSIRRNDVEKAYYFALKLEDFNPKMLWNRLQIIVSEDIGRANPSLPATFDVLMRWYFDDLKKGGKGTLYLSHVISLMATGDKCRDADNLIAAVKERECYEDYEIEIPDYALDMHTLRGKKMGRGIDFWWDDACYLENDVSYPKITAEAKRIEKTYWKKPKTRKPKKLVYNDKKPQEDNDQTKLF